MASFGCTTVVPFSERSEPKHIESVGHIDILLLFIEMFEDVIRDLPPGGPVPGRCVPRTPIVLVSHFLLSGI